MSKKSGIWKNKWRSLRGKILIISILALFVILSVILIIVFSFAQNYMRSELDDHIKKRQADANRGISLTFNSLNLEIVSVMTDGMIYRTAMDKTIPIHERTDIISARMSDLVGLNAYIENIMIVTHDGEYFLMRSDEEISFPDKKFLSEISESDKIVTLGSFIPKADDSILITLGRKYRWFSTGDDIGYIILYLREEGLAKLYQSIVGEDGQSFLVDEDLTIISHPNKKDIGKIYLDTENFFDIRNAGQLMNYSNDGMAMISSVRNRFEDLGLNWTIVTIVQKSYVDNMTRQFDRYIWFIELICVPVALFMAIWLGFYILRPINKLKHSILTYKYGYGNVENKENPSALIMELDEAYTNMVTRIDELLKKNNEEKEKQREFELIALQAQVNPHFLYNTLDTIVWYARIKEQPEIEKIAMSLAKFFRMSLHNGDRLITVEEEITLVKSYLMIEQIRFSNKINISFNIESEILDVYILKLVLQPVVENALKHGMRSKKEGGSILINGIKQGDYIIFEVIDNGEGFDSNTPLPEGDGKMGGYGLRNLDERLKMEYGERSGVILFSKKGNGTRVIIKIKFK